MAWQRGKPDKGADQGTAKAEDGMMGSVREC